MSLIIPLNNNWRFCQKYTEAMMQEDFSGGEEVRIPHTVCQLPFSYCNENDYQMISGYRYELFAPQEWQDKSVRITFEGAAHKSVLFCNNIPVADHKCGYTAFEAELCDNLKYGENNILVLRLDSEESLVPPFGKVIDYLTYGGIYREIFLKITPKSFIDNVFVYTPAVSIAESRLCADVKLVLQHEHVFILPSLLTFGGEVVKSFGEFAAESTFSLNEIINEARLWNVDSPNLYKLRISITRGGEILDTAEITFGFRTCHFNENGFYLNGKLTKLRGLNRHQSWPYVGYAMPKRAQRLDVDILKNELGLNAVRTSHYPQSHHFLNACDEKGLLVFTEIPGWQHIGTAEWKHQAVRNTKDMVMQYRNHPSIILWGVRINESADDDEFYTATNAAAHELDKTRQTGGVRNMLKSSLLEDVYTYNDFVHSGDNNGLMPKSEVTSDTSKGYIVSEHNGHMYSTKAYDDERHRQSHALRHAAVLNAAQKSGIAGSFGWCAFDYNTHKEFGSGDRVCHHGVMDMFRNPKPAAYVYKSQQDNEPVLFVSGEMNIGDHPAGDLGTPYVFTNADTVRFYKGGELVREFSGSDSFKDLPHPPICIDDTVGDLMITHEGFDKKTNALVKQALSAIAKYGPTALPLAEKLNVARLMTTKHFTYNRGLELFEKYMSAWGGMAKEYHFEAIKNGQVAAKVTKEPVYSTALQAKADTFVLQEEDSYDVATVRFCAKDQNDNILYYCFDPVVIIVDGPLEIIGPDITPLRGGVGGTYLRTIGEKGIAKVTFKAVCGECYLSFEIK